MDEAPVDERELVRALKDMDMGPIEIQQVMKCFHLGETNKCKLLLTSHRAKLLSDVHATQDKLYRMDVFMHHLNSGQ